MKLAFMWPLRLVLRQGPCVYLELDTLTTKLGYMGTTQRPLSHSPMLPGTTAYSLVPSFLGSQPTVVVCPSLPVWALITDH